MSSVGQASGQSRPSLDVTDERLVAHALAVASIFGTLRAIVGQLSGMLILLQARLARDPGDLPDIRMLRERRDEAVERIAHLNPPLGRTADRSRLQEVVVHLDAAISTIEQIRRACSNEHIDGASARLIFAYRLMQSICDHRIGLTMVDTSHACCTCGKKLV
jgi:hypothetical protein